MRTVTPLLRKIYECDTQNLLSSYQIILELVSGKKRKIKALLNLVMVVMNLSKVKSRERENEKAKLKEKRREIRDAQCLLTCI